MSVVPQVRGRCPECKNETLFLGESGYVTCSWIDCPNPSAASQQLVEQTSTRYVEHFMTEQENELLQLSGRLAAQASCLPVVHEADREEIAFHIHAIQNIILARAAYQRSQR